MLTVICAWIIREKQKIKIKAVVPIIVMEESDYSTQIIHNTAAASHTMARS